MFRTSVGKVLPPILLVVVQVIAIVDFNFDGNPKSDAQICCMAAHTFPPEPFAECYAQHVKELGESFNNNTLMCIHLCYYNAIGMFTGGKLMGDKYREYRDTLELDLREPFTRDIQFCAGFVAKAIQKSAQLRQLQCSPIPYLFNRCLAEAGLVNCPKSRWMNSTLCTEMVLKLKQKYGKAVQLSPTE